MMILYRYCNNKIIVNDVLRIEDCDSSWMLTAQKIVWLTPTLKTLIRQKKIITRTNENSSSSDRVMHFTSSSSFSYEGTVNNVCSNIWNTVTLRITLNILVNKEQLILGWVRIILIHHINLKKKKKCWDVSAKFFFFSFREHWT